MGIPVDGGYRRPLCFVGTAVFNPECVLDVNCFHYQPLETLVPLVAAPLLHTQFRSAKAQFDKDHSVHSGILLQGEVTTKPKEGSKN